MILIGEGNNQRVRNLLGVEKKKHARVVGEVPIYDIVAGTDNSESEGVVPVKKLSKHIMKLPKNITPADVTDVLQRLKALDAMRPTMPIPQAARCRPAPGQARQVPPMRGGRRPGPRSTGSDRALGPASVRRSTGRVESLRQ